jgi:hypothetical protein
MSFIRKHTRLLLTAACCLAIGAGASAVASAGASTSGASKAAAGQGVRSGGLRSGALRRLAKRTVHADLVVGTRNGFETVSFDRGKVDSVSGRQLMLTESTRTASYKTVTLTIPENARIRDDRRQATLSALQPGQRVIVLTSPRRTFVIAHTPKTS